MSEFTQAEKHILYNALCAYRQELWRTTDRQEYHQVNDLMTRLLLATIKPAEVDRHAM